MTCSDPKRRHFLKQSLGILGGSGLYGGALSTLAGCSSLDSLFASDKREFEDEVFIIGAGAAGLMAAYTLKKNRIPFRLFEASNRPGGRLYTLQTSDGIPLEMGADTFESHHRLVFELLKEFNLEWEESVWDPRQQALWRASSGEVLTDLEYQRVSAPLIQKMIQDRVRTFGSSDQYQILAPFLAQELDSLSMAQYLKVNWPTPDNRVVQYWDALARYYYSAESEKVSALRWIWDQQVDRKSRNLYRVKGGWRELNTIMFDRIAGVIPNHLVRLGWSLTGLRKTETGFRCIFKTSKGTEILKSRHLILAMPINQYRKVDGLFDLDISAEKKAALKSVTLGEAAKLFVAFPTGTTESQNRVFLRDKVKMSYIKSSNKEWIGGLRGGVNSQWTIPDIENWRISLMKDASQIREGEFEYHVVNWKDRPFIQGARSLWGPGQWGQYSIVFEIGDFNGSLEWAGEHVPSTEKSTVHAALLSGQKAALKMTERVRTVQV